MPILLNYVGRDGEWIEFMCRLGISLSYAGQESDALKVLSSAEAAAPLIRKSFFSGSNLADISDAYLQAGFLEEAQRIAAKTRNIAYLRKIRQIAILVGDLELLHESEKVTPITRSDYAALSAMILPLSLSTMSKNEIIESGDLRNALKLWNNHEIALLDFAKQFLQVGRIEDYRQILSMVVGRASKIDDCQELLAIAMILQSIDQEASNIFLTRSVEESKRIEDVDVLLSLALDLAEVGKFQEASGIFERSRRIKNITAQSADYERVINLILLAKQFGRNGNGLERKIILETALEYGASNNASSRLQRFIISEIAHDDYEKALDLVSKIGNPVQQILALNEISLLLHNNSQPDLALRMCQRAQELTSEFDHYSSEEIFAQCNLATTFAILGQSDTADHIFADMCQRAATVYAGKIVPTPMDVVIEAMAQSDRLESAIKVYETTDSELGHARESLIAAMIKSEQFERARKWLVDFNAYPTRSMLRFELVSALVRKHDLKTAYEITLEIDDEYYRSISFSEIASAISNHDVAFDRASFLTEACSTAYQIPDYQNDQKALALVKAGLIAEGFRTTTEGNYEIERFLRLLFNFMNYDSINLPAPSKTKVLLEAIRIIGWTRDDWYTTYETLTDIQKE